MIFALLLSPPLASAQEEGVPIDDTVEEDIFFDELPDDGIDFIDELPTDESPDGIYSGKKKKKKKRKNVDVKDKGPIELKQGPGETPDREYTTPDIIKEDPLFSVEKEQPLEGDKQQPTEVGKEQEQFQFPDAVEKGAPIGPEDPTPRPTVDAPTPPTIMPEPELDSFGRPVEPAPVVQEDETPEEPKALQDEPPLFDEVPEEPESLVYDRDEAPPVRPSGPISPSVTPFDDVEVIYNSRSGKEVKIKHPNAEKGLIRITQDRTYVYRVPRSEQDRAFSFRIGMFDPENLENPDTGATFEQLYDSTEAPILFFEYEWQWFQTAIGKLGLKMGSGLFVAEGSGSFKNNFPENGSKNTPLEKFTLVAFPNSLGAIYRAQFWDTQPFVPYADGGVMGITFAEFRDDKDAPKLGLGYAGFFSVGGALNLGLLDNLSLLELDREYGINTIFLTGEFRQVVQLGGKFNFESSTISGGVLMEF